MTGVEIAVGYAVAYLVRKARRAGGRVDGEVDRVVDAGMERVHELVSGALGDDPAWRRAAAEAETGEVSVRTRRRLTDALEEAAEGDAGLAAELAHAVGAVAATGDGIAIGGDVTVRAEGGSAAALRMGDVTLGSPPPRMPRQ